MILHQKLLIFEEFKEAYILFMNCTPIELQIKNNYVTLYGHGHGLRSFHGNLAQGTADEHQFIVLF